MNRNSRINHFIKTLAARNVTIALAESMTCGLAAHMLSTCKGTAGVLMGSVVCYNEKVKRSALGVSDAMIRRYTAESKEVTHALAKGLKKLVSADLYASVTGLASAGGSEGPGKPVGTVFFAVIYNNRKYAFRSVFRGTPLEVRQKACLRLYEIILRCTVQ